MSLAIHPCLLSNVRTRELHYRSTWNQRVSAIAQITDFDYPSEQRGVSVATRLAAAPFLLSAPLPFSLLSIGIFKIRQLGPAAQ
jgi:hypothetical protein